MHLQRNSSKRIHQGGEPEFESILKRNSAVPSAFCLLEEGQVAGDLRAWLETFVVEDVAVDKDGVFEVEGDSGSVVNSS